MEVHKRGYPPPEACHQAASLRQMGSLLHITQESRCSRHHSAMCLPVAFQDAAYCKQCVLQSMLNGVALCCEVSLHHQAAEACANVACRQSSSWVRAGHTTWQFHTLPTLEVAAGH